MKKRFVGCWQAKPGQSLAEYGLILALVAVVAISGLTTLGGSISTQLAEIAVRIGAVSAGSTIAVGGGGGATSSGGSSASGSGGGTANTSEGNCNGGCGSVW